LGREFLVLEGNVGGRWGTSDRVGGDLRDALEEGNHRKNEARPTTCTKRNSRRSSSKLGCNDQPYRAT